MPYPRSLCWLRRDLRLDDHAALSRPIAGRIFFAGEAATTEAPSYAHGALLGGRRAAREVLETAGIAG